MALSQTEWSFSTLPAPSSNDGTFELPNEASHAMPTHDLPTKATTQSPELPEEMWMQILSLLHDKADLHHLSLISKRMQALTTKLLYEHFDLVLAPEMGESLSRVLTTRNTGRDFMRHLTLSLDIEDEGDPRVPYKLFGMLLENLPLDKLSHFRSTSHRPLPQNLLKRLLQTQKNLQHLEILPSGAVDAHHDPNTKDGCTAITDCLERAGLEQLQSVRVVPDIPQIVALCSIALQKSNSQTVISLEVDAHHWVDAAHFAHAQNSMATKDQLVESLFAHLPRASPGHKGPFDNLTTLVLRDVKLNLSKYTWFTYLSLSKLQRLELHHCKAADIFLLQLTSGPEVPALKAFSMVHDLGENSHDRSILGIEQLLQDTGNGIVELELCLRNAPELPEVTSIARHGGSLRRLTLDIGSAKTCLRRGRAPRPLGGVCPTQTTSNRSARCQSRVQHTLCQIPRIRALHHKHRLEVLSLLSLPTDYTTIQSIGFFAAKDYALGRLVAEIFAVHRSRATSLQVIAFGTRERADSHLGPRYFVPYEHTIKN